MRARRPRRDAKRLANLLVRPTCRDEANDLELSARQPGDAGCDAQARRSRTELAQPFSRFVQLALRAQVREYLMGPPQLACRALGIPAVGERARQLSPHAGCVPHERN